MSQRNMLCTREVYEMEIELGQNHHQEPSSLFSNTLDFPNSNANIGLQTSRNLRSHDHQSLHFYENNLFYGNQYNLQHHHVSNLGFDGLGGNRSYNPFLIPSSSSRVCPLHLTHASSDHASSSRNHGLSGISMDELGRSHHYMESIRNSCKRKNVEGLPGSYYHVNDHASSSSSLGVPLSSGLQQWEDPFLPRASLLDASTSMQAECIGNGISLIPEGSQRSVRSRSSAINMELDSNFSHHYGPLPQIHVGQSTQASSSIQPELQRNIGYSRSNSSQYGPYLQNLHGRSFDRDPPEIGGMGIQRYQDIATRFSGIITNPSQVHQYHSQQMQDMGGHGYGYHQTPSSLYRPLTDNLHHGNLNPSRDGLESAPRYLQPSMPNFGGSLRPYWRSLQITSNDINGRTRNFPSEADGVLEFSGFYDVGNFVDEHRDMRLDIDDMSYEELLALEERIGDVSTGLSEETILKCLETRYVQCAGSPASNDNSDIVMPENKTCIICQEDYEVSERMGILDCGHDYHANCIKQWLMVKNICPICKMPALSLDEKR